MQVMKQHQSFAAMFAEEVDNRHKELPDDSRQIVSQMLEGYAQKEIARKTGFSLAKVERIIAIVRKHWDPEQEESRDHKKQLTVDPRFVTACR